MKVFYEKGITHLDLHGARHLEASDEGHTVPEQLLLPPDFINARRFIWSSGIRKASCWLFRL